MSWRKQPQSCANDMLISVSVAMCEQQSRFACHSNSHVRRFSICSFDCELIEETLLIKTVFPLFSSFLFCFVLFSFSLRFFFSFLSRLLFSEWKWGWDMEHIRPCNDRCYIIINVNYHKWLTAGCKNAIPFYILHPAFCYATSWLKIMVNLWQSHTQNAWERYGIWWIPQKGNSCMFEGGRRLRGNDGGRLSDKDTIRNGLPMAVGNREEENRAWSPWWMML